MNIDEHNQRKPLKRATLQLSYHHNNKTMNNQSLPPATVQQVIDKVSEEMGVQRMTSPTTDSGSVQTEQRGTRRPRDDDSDSHFENDHIRKKTSLDYHDTKTEGAYFISSKFQLNKPVYVDS